MWKILHGFFYFVEENKVFRGINTLFHQAKQTVPLC